MKTMSHLVTVLVIILSIVTPLVTSLTIDSQLVDGKKTCFVRLAVGEKLPPGDATRRVDTPSASKCERECSEDKDRCNTFSFGISSKGNGTCELSIREILESESKIEGSVKDPDYDIYAKRTNCKSGDGDIQDPFITARPRPDPLFEDEYSGSSGPSSDSGYGGSSYSDNNRPTTSSGSSYSDSNRPSSSGGTGYSDGNRPSSSSGTGYSDGNRPSSSSGTGYSDGNRPSSNSGTGYSDGNRPSSSSGTGYSDGNRPSSSSGNGYSGSNRPGSSYQDNNRPSTDNSYAGSNKPNDAGSYGSGSSGSNNGYKPSGSDPATGYGGSTSFGGSSTYGNSQSSSYGGNGSYGSSASNTYGSSSYNGNINSNRPYGSSGSSSYSGNNRPYDSGSRPQDQQTYGSNQRPSDQYYGNRPSGSGSSYGGRPPGWIRPYEVEENQPGDYEQGNKPYGENGVSYGNSYRPHQGSGFDSGSSNYYSSSSSYSGGSSSYNYGSSSNRPSNYDNHNSRPSQGYHQDVYGGYSQDSSNGDRFHWNNPRNYYSRPYPTMYGDRFPYDKPGSYQTNNQDDFDYNRRQNNYNKRPAYDYGSSKPMYEDKDRPDIYGSGYSNYVPNKDNRPSYDDYRESNYRPNSYNRPESVAQIYGQQIAVSHGAPSYKPDDRTDRRPDYGNYASNYPERYNGYGTSAPEKPNNYGSTSPGRPNDYGSSIPEKPHNYGSAIPEKPNNYGSSSPEKPNNYGLTMPDKPNYGTQSSDRPNYGSQSSERPNYGSQSPERPNYGSQSPEKPNYGSQTPERPNGYNVHNTNRPMVEGYRGNGYDNLMPNSPIYDPNQKGNTHGSSGSFYYENYGSNRRHEQNSTSYGGNFNYYDQKRPIYNEIDKNDDSPSYKPNFQDKRPMYDRDRPDAGYGNNKNQVYGNEPPKPTYGVTENPNNSGYGKKPENSGGYGSNASARPDKDKPDPSDDSNSSNTPYKGEDSDYLNRPSVSERPDPGYGRPKGDNGKPGGYGNQDKPTVNNYRPNGYGDRPGGYNEKPDPYGQKPNGYDNRPSYDNRPMDPKGYNDRPFGYNDRPTKKPNGYDNRPNGYDNIPKGSNGYNDRPNDKPNGYDNRPNGYDNRPMGTNGYDNRPNGYDNRPMGSNGYNEKPLGYNDRPIDKPSGYDNRPMVPDRYNERPVGYNDRPIDKPSGYDNRPMGPDRYNQRPVGYNDRPDGEYDDRPSGYNERPQGPNGYNNRPNYDNRPSGNGNRPGEYETRPDRDDNKGNGYGSPPDRYDDRPDGYYRPTNFYKGYSEKHESYSGSSERHSSVYNSVKGEYSGNGEYEKDELNRGQGYGPTTNNNRNFSACYRRVLAGKRVHDRAILGVVPCERLEDCQRTCAEERRFACETFNYRLDPSNRGKGVCEMTATPVALLDIRKDFIEDRDYDFYELDRNSAPDCSLGWPHYQLPGKFPVQGSWRPPGGYTPGKYGHFPDNRRQECSGCSGSYRPGLDRFPDDRKPGNDVGYYSGDRNNWKGWQQEDYNRGSDRNYDRRWDRHFVPYEITGGNDKKSWGQYGGSYGGSHYSFNENHKDSGSSFNYWGLDGHDKHYLPNSSRYPSHGVTTHFDDQRKHDEHFDYHNLGQHSHHGSHHDSHHKWEGHHGSYGGGFGYGSHNTGSWHPLHGLTPNEGYGPNQDRVRPGYNDEDEDVFGGYNKHIECSSRSGSGFRFGHSVIRKALQVRDINECERSCFTDSHIDCKSYSFRYTRGPTDNCFLTDREYRSLDLYNDVEPDRDSDIYAMNPDRKFCKRLEVQGPGGRPGYDNSLESDCFWRVRSGRKLTPEVTKAALEVRTLAECEEECLRFTTFTCRAFSFRHGSPVIGDSLSNCLLADSPASALAPSALVPAPPCALYERGSYGRGCEGDPFRLDSPQHRPTHRARKRDEMCYLQYDTSAKLLPSAVRSGARLPTEHACKVLCAEGLRKGRSGDGQPTAHFRCMSFSYTSDPSLPPGKDNCLLSDIQLRDLQPGLDYTPARTHWLFAFDTFDPDCEPAGPPGYGSIPPPSSGPDAYDHGISHPGHLDPIEPVRPFRPDPPGYPGGPPDHSRPGPHDYPRPLPGPSDHLRPRPSEYPRPGGFPGPSRPEISGPSGPGYPGSLGPSGPPRPGSIGAYDGNRRHETGDLGQDTWAHFTVSGWPCRRGTRCAPNRVAGYWSCELEGGEVGSWDYCCRPAHHCGHSRGLDYPWCYVGGARDQWRPCSDQYYPYAHSSPSPPHQGPSSWDRPSGRPYERPGYNDRNDLPGYVRVPTLETNRVKYHHNYPPPRGSQGPNWVPVRLPEEQDGPFQDPPKPGGFGTARYWPVSYLHKNGPPNSTYYKYDTEKNKNGISRNDFDRPINKNRDSERRRDDKIDQKPVESNTDKIPNTPSATDLSTIPPRSGRDKENDQTTTDSSRISDDGMVLISSSNKNMGLPDPMDKRGRIVKTNISKNEDDNKGAGKLDDKLENFSGEAVEVFTVDEPSKVTDKDAKANLERLLKEEKQIEEIGKSFGRRGESRTSIVVEKRSDHDYGIRSGYRDNFEPVFVPVKLEDLDKRSDSEDKVKLGIPEESYGNSFRNFSSRSGRNLFLDENHSKGSRSIGGFHHNASRDVSFNRFDTSKNALPAPERFNYEVRRHVSTAATLDTKDHKNTILHNNQGKPNHNSNEESVMKSVVNNGQVFYEVSPEDAEEKRQLGHVERVEIKDRGVNVRVAGEKPEETIPDKYFGGVRPISKLELSNNNEDSVDLTAGESVNHRSHRDETRASRRDSNFENNGKKFSSFDRNTAVDFIETTTQSFAKSLTSTTQFGVRTGRVKKVELPFPSRNLTGSRIVKRGRRNYRLSYNPNEVRKRLLEKKKLRESEETSLQ